MLVAIGFVILASVSLTVVINGLRKAPEGYEDENGFHIIRDHAHRPKLSALTRRSKQREAYPVAAEHTA